jgi:primosomal protein N' (replication factor Y)
MPTYLEIAVNIPQVTDVFHYHLPEELEGLVGPGHLVVVPFGRQQVQGVVLRRLIQPEVAKTRPVHSLVDAVEVLTADQIILAEQLAEANLVSVASIIDMMLPPGLSQRAETVYTVNEAAVDQGRELSRLDTRLVNLLRKRGPLRAGQIDRAMPKFDWRRRADLLTRQGLLDSVVELPDPNVRPKVVRMARLSCPPDTAEQALAELGRAGSQALVRRQAILRYLIEEPGPVDVSWLYAESGGSLADLRYLAERDLVALSESEIWRDPLEQIDVAAHQPLTLTKGQRLVWDAIRDGMRRSLAGEPVKPILLHGVTGSGKTEIYLRAVAEILRAGKQAIVLVPEIALTPQTVRRFLERFPGRVGLVHSQLSAGERYDTWRRARSGNLSVIVGPRSALFTPLPDLGLIILDECHDTSYYQTESPSYNALDAAVLYARLAGLVCLMGSATPDVVSTYRAQQGDWQYLHLPDRILAHRAAVRAQMERLSRKASTGGSEAVDGSSSRYRPFEADADSIELPPVRVVDMRQELRAGNRSIFSSDLQAALAIVLDRGQQAILFLNRLGTATYVFCRDCGYSLKCPRCDLPLTFHEARRSLTCHHCGYQRGMPATCPQCGSSRIRQYGTGTERVESEVVTLFPNARVLRWDYTTTRAKGAHEMILSHFAAYRADILVGTQMLAKGLDLPFVTLVGVVLADVGLNLPDYRAPERTFQVLTQVAGRAGRSPLGGEVILQTFQPDHYVIKAAAMHDYRNFYRQELAYRQQLGYPPYANLVRLEYRHRDAGRAERVANQLAAEIRAWMQSAHSQATQMIGPAPCFFARQDDAYRWQIILRGPNPQNLLRDRALKDWRIEINPASLL